MKIYLAGAINGCSDAEARDWRNYASSKMTGIVFDPMIRDYRGRELEEGIARIIVEQDKADIIKCDLLLVFYEKPSIGTAMEIIYAHGKEKEIVLVDKSNKPLSPWLIYHSSKIFESLDEAINYVNTK